MSNRDKNFDSFTMDFCVQVYDFISDFGENPIGISIIELYHVEYNDIDRVFIGW